MSEEDLIDLRTRTPEERRAIASKGGSMNTEKQKVAHHRLGVANAKCKKCTLKCQFKDDVLKRDPESRCIVPALKDNAEKYHTAVRFKDISEFEYVLQDILDLYEDRYTNAETPREKERYANRLVGLINMYKGIWHPAPTKELVVSVDATDKMLERLREIKEREHSIIITKEEKKKDEVEEDDEQ